MIEFHLKISADDYVMIEFIEELMSNRVHYTKVWGSKYNKNVTYDYEPFCKEGFNVIYSLPYKDTYAKYVRYMYNKFINKIVHLEKCYELNSEVQTNEKQKTQCNQ